MRSMTLAAVLLATLLGAAVGQNADVAADVDAAIAEAHADELLTGRESMLLDDTFVDMESLDYLGEEGDVVESDTDVDSDVETETEMEMEMGSTETERDEDLLVLGCSGHGMLEVCVEVHPALEAGIRSCLETGAADATEEEVAVTGGVKGRTPFVRSEAGSGALSCVAGAAVVAVDAAGEANVHKENLLLEGTLMGLSLTVVADDNGGLAVNWHGTLMSGEMAVGRSEAVDVGFSVNRPSNTSEVVTEVYLDISDLADGLLDLPSRLSFSQEGLPFFEGGALDVAESCPFDAVVVAGADLGVAVPGVEAALVMTKAQFDLCAFLSDADKKTPFLTVAAGMAGPVEVNGVPVEGLTAALSAAQDADVAGAVAWTGSVAGTVQVFGGSVVSAAEAQFTREGMSALSVAVDMETGGLHLVGDLHYVSGGCSSANRGAVSLSIPSVGGFAGNGTLVQKDGCVGVVGTTEPQPLWVVDVELAADAGALEVAGVSLVGASAHLESWPAAPAAVAMPPRWSGTVSGTVALGSGSTGTAEVTVDGVVGLISVAVQGAVSVGPVRGAVSLEVSDGVMRGNGSFVFGAGADAAPLVPTFSAAVVHVSTYRPENAHMPVWDVRGSLSSLSVHGFMLDSVSVVLSAAFVNPEKAGDVPELAWNGSVAGAGSLEGTSVALAAAVEEGEFGSLVGAVVVEGEGLVFNGSIEITADNARDEFALLAGEGEVVLTATSHTFMASLLYNKSARAEGDVRYAVTGTAVGALQLDGLELAAASFEATGVVSGSALTWSGHLAATGHLFGGSSSVQVVFAEGELQAAEVHTMFMTPNGMLQAAVDFVYVNSCTEASRGHGSAKVRLPGTADLAVVTDVAYHPCSGAMELTGTYDGRWDGPGAQLEAVSVSLHTGGHGGAAMLSTRTWVGTMNATTAAGLSVSVEFNSSNPGAVVSTLEYEDSHVRVTATVGGTDCTGEGLLIVKDLPHNIPAMELGVSLTKACGADADQSWRVEGSLADMRIPFYGKTLTISSATVEVTSSASGAKTVSVQGAFLKDFELDLSFPLPLRAEDVGLRGAVRAGAVMTPDGFATAWQGSGSASPLADSLGAAAPGMVKGLKGLALSSAEVVVDFGGTVSVTATGTAFGLDFAVAVSVVKTGTVWNYAMAFTADEPGSVSLSGSESEDLPVSVRQMVKSLSPSWVRFSLAKAALVVQGVSLRRGLSLAAFLGEDNGPLKAMVAACPSGLEEQVAAAGGGGAGVTVVADIVSEAEMTVFVMLAGQVAVGDRAVLREVALAFVVKTGVPEMGFKVVLDFTVGGGADAQTFSAGGFIGLSAAGSLSVALSVDSDTPWVRPFGVAGVKVLFPLGVKMTITPALLPSQFALIGGLQIGGASGTVAVGVDLQDFSKCALTAEVEKFNLKGIVTDVVQCKDCLGRVASVLSDVSVEYFAVSFNPDPVKAVAITIADVSVTVPAGVSIEVEDLRLWGVVHVVSAHFAASEGALEIAMLAEPVEWGPVSITSADGKSGPTFEVALTSKQQEVRIDGRAVVLGQSVALLLELSDARKYGHLVLSLGSGLSVDVELEAVGTPGKRGFSNTLTGTVKSDIVRQAAERATSFLLELGTKATSALRSAGGKVSSAQRKVRSVTKKLKKVQYKAMKKISSAKSTVNKWKKSLDKKKKSCKSKEKTCKRKWWKCGAVPKCWIGYGTVKVAYYAAKKVLNAAERAVKAGISVAKKAVKAADKVLGAAKAVLRAASAVVTAFKSIARAVGGALKDALRIHSLVFSSDLSNSDTAVSVKADMTVVGHRFNFAFKTNVNYEKFVSNIYNEFRHHMRQRFGKLIKAL